MSDREESATAAVSLESEVEQPSRLARVRLGASDGAVTGDAWPHDVRADMAEVTGGGSGRERAGGEGVGNLVTRFRVDREVVDHSLVRIHGLCIARRVDRLEVPSDERRLCAAADGAVRPDLSTTRSTDPRSRLMTSMAWCVIFGDEREIASRPKLSGSWVRHTALRDARREAGCATAHRGL